MFAFLISCGSAPFFEENIAVDNGSWKFDSPVKMKVDIKDSSSTYNIYLNARNTRDYEYQNLIIFLKISDPEGMPSIDTLEYRVADEDGKWTGEVSESLVMNSWLTYKNKQFDRSGTFTFEIWHGMSDMLLSEITDVGIRIEKN